MADHKFDVVVVGSGVLGVFHAYAAARRGLRVALLEQDEMPSEASVRNFGMSVPSGMQPGHWHELAERSAQLYCELEARQAIELQHGGMMYVAETELEAAVVEQFADLAPSIGYKCRLLSAAETVAANPYVRPEFARAALLFADEFRFEAQHMLARLIPWLVAEFNLHYFPRRLARHAEVVGGRARIATDEETFSGELAFICNGARVRDLLPHVFAGGDLVFCKLQMLRTGPQPGIRLPTRLGSGLSLHRYPAFQQVAAWQALDQANRDSEYVRRGIHVLAAQDADGRMVLGDSHSFFDQRPDESRDERTDDLILEYAYRMLALPNPAIDDRWCGIYTERANAEPLRATIGERIHVLTGVGGRGMTCGPALAETNFDDIVRSLHRESSTGRLAAVHVDAGNIALNQG